MRLVWSVPAIIDPMPPLALSVSARAAKRHEISDVGPYQREYALGYGVVEVVSETLEELVRTQRGTLAKNERAAVYAAAIGVAVKRGLLSQLLEVVVQLLAAESDASAAIGLHAISARLLTVSGAARLAPRVAARRVFTRPLVVSRWLLLSDRCLARSFGATYGRNLC